MTLPTTEIAMNVALYGVWVNTRAVDSRRATEVNSLAKASTYTVGDQSTLGRV